MAPACARSPQAVNETRSLPRAEKGVRSSLGRRECRARDGRVPPPRGRRIKCSREARDDVAQQQPGDGIGLIVAPAHLQLPHFGAIADGDHGPIGSVLPTVVHSIALNFDDPCRDET
jgi:hypothetical protein